MSSNNVLFEEQRIAGLQSICVKQLNLHWHHYLRGWGLLLLILIHLKWRQKGVMLGWSGGQCRSPNIDMHLQCLLAY
jgi:hypothetical protein